MAFFNRVLIEYFHRLNWFKAPKNDTSNCYGVDPNRNFDYKWMKRGTSSNECSEFYGGPYASSEPEVKLLTNFLTDSRRSFDMLISLNGYGQKVSYSSEGFSPRELDDARDIARAGVKNLKMAYINSTRYTIDFRGKKSGSIDQFGSHKANIKHSYAIEAKDDETHGFFVPATSIRENALELFTIVSGMVQNIID